MEENRGLIQRLLRTFARRQAVDDLLAMCEHPSGYKRENAVRRLGMLGDPTAIPKLLVRANDWVPQVRNAASDTLKRLLKKENAKAYINSLPELLHLERCGRSDHRDLIANVMTFLLLPENVHHIRDAITNANPSVARIAVRMCVDYDLLAKPAIVSQCLSHPDVVVRNVGSGLFRDLNGADLEAILEKAVRDPYMPVRREAFQLYLKRFPEIGLRLAHTALFDRHISIREIAVKKLIEQGIDVEQVLVSVLLSPNQTLLKLRGALSGLAILKAKSQIPLVRSFVSDIRSSLRKASLQTLTRLDEDEARPLLVAALTDDSPGVAKESMNLLRKGRLRVRLPELEEVVKGAACKHTIDVCIVGSRELNKWDRLIFLLGLFLRISDQETATDQASSEIKSWDGNFNRSASQPTAHQKMRIAQLYERSSDSLSEALRRSLEFTLRGSGVAV